MYLEYGITLCFYSITFVKAVMFAYMVQILDAFILTEKFTCFSYYDKLYNLRKYFVIIFC